MKKTRTPRFDKSWQETIELYGRRIESDPALQSRIAADVSEKIVAVA